MMRKARVTNPGSSYLLPGSVIDKNELVKVNNELEQRKEAGEQIEPVSAKLFFSVSQRLHLQQTALCLPLHSRKPQEFLPTLQFTAR